MLSNKNVYSFSLKKCNSLQVILKNERSEKINNNYWFDDFSVFIRIFHVFYHKSLIADHGILAVSVTMIQRIKGFKALANCKVDEPPEIDDFPFGHSENRKAVVFYHLLCLIKFKSQLIFMPSDVLNIKFQWAMSSWINNSFGMDEADQWESSLSNFLPKSWKIGTIHWALFCFPQ